MSQKLLLTTSIVFEGANFIDEIHQSVIDLESNIPKEEISNLIIKALSYIDKNLDNQTIDELISLIISCFLHYPDPSDEIINDIANHSFSLVPGINTDIIISRYHSLNRIRSQQKTK